MMNRNTLQRTLHGLLAAASCAVAQAAPAVWNEVHSFHIPPEDASSAVLDFAKQSGMDIMALGTDLNGIKTNAISGNLSIDAALKLLVAGTGLTYSYSPVGRAISLRAAAGGKRPVRPAPKQDPPPSPPVSAPEAVSQVVVLEEIVVTAQRRPEDLQDVPISAQVIEQQTLIWENLNSLDDLSQTMPSVHVGSNSRSANLYIRGTGSGESQTFDQSVGVFSDDIYHGRARMSDVMLFDLDRIEVLKGPQTTFFGNNAIAGAFSIITRKPDRTFEAFTRELYGEHGQYAAEAALGGPVTGALAVRFAVMADGTDGWLHNVTLGRDVPAENNVGGRLTFLLQPGPDLDATLKIEASRNRNIGSLALKDGQCPPPAPFVAAGFCHTALALGAPMGLGNPFIAQNDGQQIKLDTGEYVLTVRYRHWGQTFTSVSGFYDYHFNEDEDADGTPLNLLNIQAPEYYKQLSQELRVASPPGGRLEYLAGVYFHTDQLSFTHDNSYFFLTPTVQAAGSLAPLVPYLPLGQDMSFVQPERSYSAFEALTWHLTDALRWTQGLRASWVSKRYDWNLYYGTAAAAYGDIVPLPAPQAALAQGVANSAGLGTANTLSGHRSDAALMPSSQIQADFATAAMAYVSFSRGWKAGGFNGSDTTGLASNLPFAPEHVNAYEVGFKSEWVDHRLRVNVDAFRSDYSNLQVATNVASGSGAILSLVRNAASSRSQGGELEMDFIPSRAWQLSAYMTYDPSRYLHYPDVAPTQLQQAFGAQSQDLSGRPTEFAPAWSGTLGASYRVQLGHCRLTTNVAGIASSSYFLTGNDDPTVEQGAYVRLDGRISLGSLDEQWAVDVIGKNLTNREILTFGVNWPTAPGSTWLQTEETRGVAVQARARW